MESYKTKLVCFKLFTSMATMKANHKKQEYELKEKGLELLGKLLNSLPEQLEKDEQSRHSYTNHPYATFIMNYFFKIIKNPLDLLEENFIFAFVTAIEFIISLNDINIQNDQNDNDSLLDQKIQELFNQIKNKCKEEMIRSGLDENKECDYNLIVFNQLLIVKQLERMIEFYQSLNPSEQSKIPLIKMINLDELE